MLEQQRIPLVTFMPYVLIACSILYMSHCWLRCPICDEATLILAFLSYALQVEADKITKSQGSYPFIGRPAHTLTHAEGENRVDQRIIHNEDRMVIENEADEAKESVCQGMSHHGNQCVAQSYTARMSEVMPSSARRQTIHSPNDDAEAHPSSHPLHPLGAPPPTAPAPSALVEVCDLTSPDPIEPNERHPLAVRPASCKVEEDSGFLFDGDQHMHQSDSMAEPDSSPSAPTNDAIEYLTQLPPLESVAAGVNDRVHPEMMLPHTDGRHGVNIDQQMVSREAASHQEQAAAAASDNGSNQHENLKRPRRPTQRSKRGDAANALKKSPFGPYRLRVTLTSPIDVVEPLNEYDPSDCEWRQVGRRTYTASEI